MNILVTGASGFIGSSLIPCLYVHGHAVRTWSRSPAFDFANKKPIMDEWIAQLHNADAVVHLAGLAHQSREAQGGARYFQINRDGTLNLAAAAQAAGVKRFIFLSSAKVFGEGGDEIYCPATRPEPADAYAQSKWQAERLLLERFAHTMEVVILRPPLVYGRDAKANFASLIKLAKLPVPLPVAGINNQRAMIGVDNLVDLIAHCLTNPAAIGKTLLCADLQPYSLSDIVTSIRLAMNREPNIFRLPQPLLSAMKIFLGASISERLFGDFKMDCSETYKALNWIPPSTMEQILRGDTGSVRA